MEYHSNDIFNDRYVFKELLGRGSFGEVWLAYDKLAGIDVALKIYIALDNRGLSDFRNEYRSVYNANHPNILTPTHYDVWNNQPYLVMHYCPVSSESLIVELSEDEIWKFISDVSSGLTYLHEKDIIHRDIKPDNILRDTQGRYVLTDFGLSKKLRASLRRNSTRAQQEDVSGALSYMGPELFEAKPEAVKATDIWALGVTIYEMLVGELPFMGQGGIMLKNGADIPELPDKYSYGLRKLVHDCLQKNPWDRPMASQLAGYKRLTEENDNVEVSTSKRIIHSHIVKGFLFCCLVICLFTVGIPWVKKTVLPIRHFPTANLQDSIVHLSDTLDSAQVDSSVFNHSQPEIPSDFILVNGGHLSYKGHYYENHKVHTTDIDTFYICKYELTQGEYQRVMGTLSSDNYSWLVSNSWNINEGPRYNEVKGDSIPVRGTYEEFVKYCITRSKSEGYDGFYSITDNTLSVYPFGNGYRLVTPYEWVFAAFNGNMNGREKYLGGKNLSEVAWHYENSKQRPQPVGRKKPNSIGIYDMQGNAPELLHSDSMRKIYVSMFGGYNVSNWNYPQAYDPTYIFALKELGQWTYGTRIALVPKGVNNNNLLVQYDD